MTEDHVSGAYAEFRLSITRALADQLADALDDLDHAPLTAENVEAFEAGGNLKEVQELLGHSTIAVTADHYSNIFPRMAQESAEAAAAFQRRAGMPEGS